jgi:hypothetical protein
MLHINANQSHSQHYSIDDSDLIDYYVFIFDVISQIRVVSLKLQCNNNILPNLVEYSREWLLELG